jgi:oligopeptide transport system substrate-binding protein
VAAATATLKEANISLAGQRFPFYFNDEFQNRAMVEAVARQWEAAFGLHAVPTPVDLSKLAATGSGPGGFDGPFRFSWAAPYSTQDGYLGPLFLSGAIGQDNFSRYRDNTFDRRLERTARTEVNDLRRAADYASLERMLCRDVPMAPVTFGQNEFVIRTDRVGSATGAFIDHATGWPVLRELYIRGGR